MWCATNDTSDECLWERFLEGVLVAEPRWLAHSYTILMCLIFVAGVVGNLLTCVVIYSDKSLHTATNYYLFNLAVSDTVVTLAILLELNESHMLADSWKHRYGGVACQLYFMFVMILFNNGILVMTALAVERYVAICYPLALSAVPVWRRVTKVLCAIWTLAIVESVPELWTVTLIRTDSSSICFITPSEYARILNGVLAAVTFIIPLGVMVFLYSMIAFKVNTAAHAGATDNIFNHRDNRSKVNKLITLTLSFVVCWMPFFSVRILFFSSDVHRLMALDHWWSFLYKFSAVNSWFSAVLNPLLFSLMSTKFRNALKKLWNSKVRGNRPEMFRPTLTPV